MSSGFNVDLMKPNFTLEAHNGDTNSTQTARDSCTVNSNSKYRLCYTVTALFHFVEKIRKLRLIFHKRKMW